MFVCPECGDAHPTGGFCTRDGARLIDGGHDPLLGTTIGAYQIAALVGAGGMGRVYKGVNPSIGSRVAIKVLSHHCAGNPELVERFFAEARAVNLIRHESIVNIFDLARLPDRRPFIIMEFLDGEPLSTLIARRGPLPLGSLARLMGEVLGALGGAHQKGIVHRDLKPENIFVTPRGRAKVLDFGIAKLQPEQSGRSAPTRDGSLMGTPHYMAPEQAQARPVTPRTDLYAAGVILFEGACGRPPFSAQALYDLLRAQVEQPPPPPRTLRPDMPASYERVISRALAKAPEHRHQSARALQHELLAASRELPEHQWAPLGDAEPGVTTGMSSVPTPAAPASSPRGSMWPTPPAAGQIVASPPAGRRSNGLPIAVALGVLAIAGIAAAALVADSSDDTESTAVAPIELDAGVDAVVAEIAVAIDAAAVVATPEETTRTVARAGFDVSGFIPRARAMAREVFADAVLVRLDASGVRPDGRAIDPGFSVVYRFVSPSRVRDDLDCLVYVNASNAGISTYPLEGWKCDMALIGPPRCTAREVWSKAKRVPEKNAIAELGYWADAGGKGRWHFGIKDVVSSWIPDDC